jgi:hypothetical protein
MSNSAVFETGLALTAGKTNAIEGSRNDATYMLFVNSALSVFD